MKNRQLIFYTILLFPLLLLAGCTTNPIDNELLSYFEDLEGQTYWTTKTPYIDFQTTTGYRSLKSDVPYGQEQEIEYCFEEVSVLKNNKRDEPTNAVFAISLKNTSTNKSNEYFIHISESNKRKMSTLIASLETKEIRDERLNKEEEERKKLEQEAKAVRDRLSKLDKKLIKKYDEFKGITFIKHPLDASDLVKGKLYFFPYIGKDENSKWMFLKANMYINDWIFMDQVLAVLNGSRYATPVYKSYSDRVERDVVYGGVRERIDFEWSNSEVKSLGQAIASAPLGSVIKIRFTGKYYLEYTMSQEEHQAWKDMIFYYDNL